MFLYYLHGTLLLIIGNSNHCLHFANVISIGESCGNGLQKSQNKTRQGSVPKIVQVDRFQFLFQLLSEQYHCNEKRFHFITF